MVQISTSGVTPNRGAPWGAFCQITLTSCLLREISREFYGISSKTGSNIPWVTEMRYLGVYFVQSRYLKCSLTVAKRGFYGAANSIFGKIGRCASEEVILQLISSKCIPILLYGLEVLPIQKYQLNSLDFVINRFFMKLFKTSNIRIVQLCQELFHFELPSVQLAHRRKLF